MLEELFLGTAFETLPQLGVLVSRLCGLRGLCMHRWMLSRSGAGRELGLGLDGGRVCEDGM